MQTPQVTPHKTANAPTPLPITKHSVIINARPPNTCPPCVQECFKQREANQPSSTKNILCQTRIPPVGNPSLVPVRHSSQAKPRPPPFLTPRRTCDTWPQRRSSWFSRRGDGERGTFNRCRQRTRGKQGQERGKGRKKGEQGLE
ncbi:hypothetical protein E2C01_003924 [Portunus trituberculatus]|uniref:Uncharacterized protein n=1 Tax=Portunus trituberculatus TaxID=210409 RepID=A0A5B7CNI6_PORTR|nr:hypothetical protein [Portunus trituberculatus]